MRPDPIIQATVAFGSGVERGGSQWFVGRRGRPRDQPAWLCDGTPAQVSGQVDLDEVTLNAMKIARKLDVCLGDSCILTDHSHMACLSRAKLSTSMVTVAARRIGTTF